MISRKAVKIGMTVALTLLILVGLWVDNHKRQHRRDALSLLDFVPPPSAQDIQWEDLNLGDFDDHVLVGFTMAQTDLGAILAHLPCTPSNAGTLREWSHLDAGPPLSADELGCTRQSNDENWSVVRISPIEGNRVKVQVEHFAGY